QEPQVKEVRDLAPAPLDSQSTVVGKAPAPVLSTPVDTSPAAPPKQKSRAPLALAALMMMCGVTGVVWLTKFRPVSVRISIQSTEHKGVDGLTVTLDDQPLSGGSPFTVSLTPGPHRLHATAPNYVEPNTVTFETPAK